MKRHIKLCGSECEDLTYLPFELKEDVTTVQKIDILVNNLIKKKSLGNCKCRDQHSSDRFERSFENSFNPSTSKEIRDNKNLSDSVVLLGLHSCADLSPLMMRIFMCCDNISAMVLLSCCYHKMKLIAPPLPSKTEMSSTSKRENSDQKTLNDSANTAIVPDPSASSSEAVEKVTPESDCEDSSVSTGSASSNELPALSPLCEDNSSAIYRLVM